MDRASLQQPQGSEVFQSDGFDSNQQEQPLSPPLKLPSQTMNRRKHSLADDDDDYHYATTATAADIDEEYPFPHDISLMSRSERKRYREKKRRSEVNAGFDDLKDLLAHIDPDHKSHNEEINRVDLIARAVLVIRELKQDNEDLRRQRGEQREFASGNSDDKITILIPYLVPVEHCYPPSHPSRHAPSHHAAPLPPQQHQYQHHQQQYHSRHHTPFHPTLSHAESSTPSPTIPHPISQNPHTMDHAHYQGQHHAYYRGGYDQGI